MTGLSMPDQPESGPIAPGLLPSDRPAPPPKVQAPADYGFAPRPVILPASWPEPVTSGVLATMRDTPPRPLLAPVLDRGSITLLHGPRGVGLTHMTVGAAVAIATGGSFLGWKAPEPVSVLLVSGGMSAAALAVRIGMAQDAMPVRIEVEDRLRLVAPGRDGKLMPDIATPDGLQMLTDLMAPCHVLAIDDVGGLLPGDGIHVSDAIHLWDWLSDLRGTGKSVIVSQAAATRASQRGDGYAHRMLQRLADVVIRLAFPADYTVTDGARFELHFDRARHLDGGRRVPLEVRLTDKAEGGPSWHAAPLVSSRKLQLKAMLDDGMSIANAARELGISRATAYRWAQELAAMSEEGR